MQPQEGWGGGVGGGCSHAGFFFFLIITAYRSRVPPLMCACMRASQADVTLTCTRRSSARRALLTLSLPPSVCAPPDRDGVNTRSRDQAERDQTSQDPRSQWNAERGRVFFFFFFINRAPPRTLVAPSDLSACTAPCGCARSCQSVSPAGGCQSGWSGEGQDSA